MKTIPVLKRLPWVMAVIAIQFVYFPTSQVASGGIEPKLPIDVFPVYPVWIVPYVLCYPLWLFGIFWALFKLDARSFRAGIAAALFTVSVGALTFIFFPTYVVLPAITGADIFSDMLRWVQSAGGTHAALPSAHNYMTMLMSAFAIHFYPRQRWFWIAVIVIVALSTLFTGQHYILDVLAGLGLGWVGVRFGRWFVERSVSSNR